MADDDNETWLLDEGDRAIERKAAGGYSALASRERLIYCLWAADYGMRNAGDLTTAAEVYPNFLRDGQSAAQDLGFPHCIAAFSLSAQEFEQQYFDLFDGIIAEIRAA
ncbi:hypothetical protein [Rhizobium bangladeshense]|uniref:hypothetical protein n=1 Tax=Rhizobium bangladeshense TaxID=1138189 RepID=UPI0007E55F66|nr:hypothetical protein [Rhizobium bangladeshense]